MERVLNDGHLYRPHANGSDALSPNRYALPSPASSWLLLSPSPSLKNTEYIIRSKCAMKSQRNKPRLLLTLYARPKHPESYHYALLICPKITAAQNTKPLRATKYHVKNTIENINDRISQPWRFEQSMNDDINLEPR